jgi:hypothetical protein
MKKGLFIVIAAAMFGFISCSKERIRGNGSVATEQRTTGNFSKVYNSGSTDVYITQGSVYKVEVRGYSNLLPYFETRLENGTLKLGYRPGVNVSNDNTEVFITMPALDGLQLAGSGNISTAGNFTGSSNFESRIDGSGNITIAQGSTQNFNSSITGSGNIYAFGMIAGLAETNTVGSGNTEITATNQLRVRIEGSGNVYYRSTPSVIANITGSGVVAPR